MEIRININTEVDTERVKKSLICWLKDNFQDLNFDIKIE